MLLSIAAVVCLLPKRSVYEVSDYGIYPDGSDIGEKLNCLITNVQQNSGGSIQFQSGVYYSSRQITFFAEGSPLVQPNVWLRGTAPHASYSAGGEPKSGTILLMNSTNPVAHVIARGFGALKLTDLIFRATNHQSIPFIKMIHTTPKFYDLMFYGSAQNPGCTEDGIVFGGDGPDDFVTGGDNASFQGYGAVVQDCYFNRIRVPLRFAVHANSLNIRYNTIMNECGGTNNPWGSAIVLDSMGFGPITGNNIVGHLIEMPGFTNGFYIGSGASKNNLDRNNLYDPSKTWHSTAYYFNGAPSGNSIVAGQVPPSMSLKGGYWIGQEVRSAIPGETNDVYTTTHFQNAPVQFIGHTSQPHYIAGPYSFRQRLSDNGVIWSVNNPETSGTNSDIARLLRDPSDNSWINLYRDGHVYAGNNLSLLSKAGAETFLGDPSRIGLGVRDGRVNAYGDIVSWGTNTFNADLGTAPTNFAAPVGWLPFTNSGVRFYMPVYH